MTVLLQVSDPHFGTERAPVVAALQRLVDEQRPDLLLLSGDITQRATSAQFAAARAFVDALGVPRTLALPGNHDIPLFDPVARLWRPYARYRRAFGEALENEFENDDLLLLTLNTTRWYRHVDGELSAQQIERVAERVQRAPPGRWRIVAVHQPLAVARQQDAHNLLHGHAEAVQRWAAAGTDVVMGGHIHLPYVLPVPGAARAAWVVQAGTAVSSRVRPGVPNSVNVLRWQRPPAGSAEAADAGARAGRRITVEQWDHVSASGRFERMRVTPLVPAPAHAR
jgi:3',5'-cyclic AMP phosphodiesterase CpdA